MDANGPFSSDIVIMLNRYSVDRVSVGLNSKDLRTLHPRRRDCG